jgi:hypothetical protein
MPHFIMTYHGGSQPKSPEEGKAHMKAYMTWIANLGKAAVVPQQPIGKTEVLGDPAGAAPMMGYTIIDVPDMDAARKIAQSCPFLMMDKATLQLSQLMQMPG